MKKIAIIGAGMTAFALSNMLKNKFKLSIYEKSRGVGGRMATRRADPFIFNHGAQYFKITTESFKQFLNPLIQKKIIKPWIANFVEINKDIMVKNNNWTLATGHFRGHPKMNSVLKYFSQFFKVNLSVKVKKVKKINNNWYIHDSNGNSFGPFDWVVFTIPPLQAAEILNKNFKYFNIISNIKMKSCYSLMLGFNEIKSIGFDVALITNGDVGWFSKSITKSNNKKFTNILINSSYDFAEKNILSSKTQVEKYLIKKASDILKVQLNNYEHKAIHFWRYAINEECNKYGSFLDSNLKIVVCGDWCTNGSVEGAFLSAEDASNKILRLVT